MFFYRGEHLELLLPGVFSECLTAFRAKKILINNFQQQKSCYIKNNSWCSLVCKYCKGQFTQRGNIEHGYSLKRDFKQSTSMKLFILEITLWMIMEGFSNSLSLWIVLLSEICHFYISFLWWTGLNAESKYSSPHLYFSTQRSDDCGSRLHCQTAVADRRFTLRVLPPCQNEHVYGNPIHLDSF